MSQSKSSFSTVEEFLEQARKEPVSIDNLTDAQFEELCDQILQSNGQQDAEATTRSMIEIAAVVRLRKLRNVKEA